MSGRAASGCAILLFLPFAGFGLVALVVGVSRFPAGDWGIVAPFLILGVIFSAVGIGGIVFVLRVAGGIPERTLALLP